MKTFAYLRQFRIGEYTVIDTALSFLVIGLLAPLLSKGCKELGWIVPWWSWLCFVLPVSIIAHLLAGTKTPLTQNFMDPSGHILVKIVIIGLVILGASSMKRAL